MTKRQHSYGQDRPLTFMDRLGGWLSARRIRRSAGAAIQGDLADLGSGYQAMQSRPFIGHCRSLTLVDLNLNPALAGPGVRLVTGRLPGILTKLKPASFDVILLHNVLEHLDEPQAALKRCQALLRKDGVLLVNVPNWLGKRLLEFAAFRLGISTPAEIDDHKMYYDPKDLWPMLVKAGFKPSNICCYKHKLWSNTFASCKKS